MDELLKRKSLSFQREVKRNKSGARTTAVEAANGSSLSSAPIPAKNSFSFSFSSLMTVCGSFLIQSFTLFKDYMRHCSLLFSTAAVVAMACSLRG